MRRHYKYYGKQLADLPKVGARRAIRLRQEAMVHALCLVRGGMSLREALGISRSTMTRYRRRAEDPSDPYCEVLQSLLDLDAEARIDGEFERSSAPLGSAPSTWWLISHMLPLHSTRSVAKAPR